MYCLRLASVVHETVAVVVKSQALTTVIDAPGERTKLTSARHLGNHDVATRIHQGAFREGVSDAVDPPPRDVGDDPHLVEQLDPLAALIRSRRIVLHLIEYHNTVR